MHELLDGVRVLDLTRLLPGEYATLLMADLGAEIVKVEEPGVGDYVRHRPPEFQGESRDHAIRNRGKRSLSIDLKDDDGREAFLDVAREADIVFESFRPGVVDRLGVGYEDVSEVNEEIVYCSISGYGQTGPYIDHPGHDLNYLGMSGILSQIGQDGSEPPAPPGVPIVDIGASLMGVSYSLAALWTARETGRGRYIDLSMFEVAANWGQLFHQVLFDEPVPERGKNLMNGGHPGNQIYETADGRYLTVNALEEKFWRTFCETVGCEEFVDEDIEIGSARSHEISAEFARVIGDGTLEEWRERFDGIDAPVEPVLSLEEAKDHPQLESRDFRRTVSYPNGEELDFYRFPGVVSGTAPVSDEPAPALGEDSIEILMEVGYSDEEIERFLRDGVVESAE